MDGVARWLAPLYFVGIWPCSSPQERYGKLTKKHCANAWEFSSNNNNEEENNVYKIFANKYDTLCFVNIFGSKVCWISESTCGITLSVEKRSIWEVAFTIWCSKFCLLSQTEHNANRSRSMSPIGNNIPAEPFKRISEGPQEQSLDMFKTDKAWASINTVGRPSNLLDKMLAQAFSSSHMGYLFHL